MKKREAQNIPAVMKWCLSIIKTSSPVEVKHTRGRFYFVMRELKEHQRDYLLSATTNHGFSYKIPDDNHWQPFDAIIYKNTSAYVAIIYPDVICLIEIRELLKIKTPSLLEDDAKKIAYAIK